MLLLHLFLFLRLQGDLYLHLFFFIFQNRGSDFEWNWSELAVKQNLVRAGRLGDLDLIADTSAPPAEEIRVQSPIVVPVQLQEVPSCVGKTRVHICNGGRLPVFLRVDNVVLAWVDEIRVLLPRNESLAARFHDLTARV